MSFDFLTIKDRLGELDGIPAGQARGAALERLMEEVLLSIPGLELTQRNVITGHGDEELDLLLANTDPDNGLPLPFGTDIIVECKSSTHPLNSAGVTRLADNSEERHLPWAILISLRGVTGTDKDEIVNANYAFRDAYTRKNCGIVLVEESELREIRSSRHLVSVLEFKRRSLIGELRPSVLDRRKLRALDPDSGFLRGWEGIDRAIRQARHDALRELLEAGVGLDVVEPGDALDRAAQTLAALTVEVERQEQEPSSDPFWRAARKLVVDVGAAFLVLIPERLDESENQRIIRYEIDNSASPRPLRASPGSELWTLLTEYHLRHARRRDWQRRESGLAVASMAIDAVIAIDDIDPADVFDDYYEQTTG